MPRTSSRPARASGKRTRSSGTSGSGKAARARTGRSKGKSKASRASEGPKPLHRLRMMRFVANLHSRGLGYAEFREGLQRADIELDNESAYGLLLTDPATFTEFVDIARESLDG